VLFQQRRGEHDRHECLRHETTGATWIAGRDCSELISLSVPTPEAAAVEAAHNSATST